MSQTYTFAMTQMPKDASGRKVQALEIREAETDRPVAICVHVEINGVLVMAFPEDDAQRLVAEWQRQANREGDIYRTAVLSKTST